MSSRIGNEVGIPTEDRGNEKKNMPSYVPRNKPIRKKEILEKREIQLLRQIKNSSSEKVHIAAEKVREAHQNYIKAQKHVAEVFFAEGETPVNNLRRKKFDEQQRLWEQRTTEEIVGIYDENGT